jgi:hypothetical protein
MTDTRATTVLATAPPTTSSDRVRQLVVTLAEIFCVVGTLVGVGVLGSRVQESSGGALAADATLLAPAGPAFSIWTPIYLGLAAYTIWQWLPRHAAAPRQRRIGLLAGASMVLNASWLLVTQQGWLWASVVVIVALLVVLTVLVVRLQRDPVTAAGGQTERVIVDGTFGAYLGWVAVATCANITTTLVESGIDPGAPWDAVAAVLVLVAVAVVGVLLARTLGGRVSIAAATVWGLVWIAVGRSTDAPRSAVTAVAAVAVAALIALATWQARTARRSGDPAKPASV